MEDKVIGEYSYKAKDSLGCGSYGHVFKAKDLNTGQ